MQASDCRPSNQMNRTCLSLRVYCSRCLRAASPDCANVLLVANEAFPDSGRIAEHYAR